MDREKIKAKVLNMVDHTPFEPASLPKNHANLTHTQPSQALSMSKSTISRQSYLDSPQHKYQQFSKQLQPTAKSVSKSKKKRYLNIVTDPHSQSLHKLRKENIVLTQNKLTLSRASKADTKNGQNVYKSPSHKKLTRNNSIKSVLSIEIQNQKSQPSQNITERIIVKEKIVPVLVNHNHNASFFQKQQLLPSRPNLKIEQHYNNHFNLINQKLGPQPQQLIHARPHIHLQPQQHIHVPQQLVNIRVMEPQIKLTSHNKHSFLQSEKSRIEDTSNQHNVTTQFFIPANENVRPIDVNPHAHRVVTNPVVSTPIRAYSPGDNNFTPIHIIQRSSIQKRQNNINQQIIQKIGNIQLSRGVYQHPLTISQNQQQKVLKLISDSNTNNPYPIMRTISKRQIHPSQISPQPQTMNAPIVNLSFCPNVQITTPQRQKILNECQIPMKFLNTPSRQQKKQNKHTLKHSPKPIKQREVSAKSIDLNNDLNILQRTSLKQSIVSDVSLKNTQNANKPSFFIETKSSNVMVRQNTFLANIREQLNQIEAKRQQSESRISKKLEELSQRTNSMVKICQQDLRSPINKSVLSLSNRNNGLKQSFCCKQNEIKQILPSKKNLQLNLKLNKQNQQQGLYLREQIMSRIFS